MRAWGEGDGVGRVGVQELLSPPSIAAPCKDTLLLSLCVPSLHVSRV